MHLFEITLALVAAFGICLGAPRIDPQQQGNTDTENAAPAADTESENESNPEGDDQPLTPNQYGRLAKFNGNFFQLYGNTEQFAGNAEAFSGNQLSNRGDLIEFLGNEHSMRSAADYLKDIQSNYYAESEKEVGRRAEILRQQGDLGGELASLAEANADLEHDQALYEKQELDIENDQFKLEKQQGRMEAQQALIELEEGKIEQRQFGVERQFGEVIHRHYLLQQELDELEAGKGNGEIQPETEPEPKPVEGPETNSVPESPAAPAAIEPRKK